jgi:hypothetical protein
MKAQGGSRGVALLFLQPRNYRSGWSTPRLGRLTPSSDPVPILQEDGWVRGPVRTGIENLALTRIRSPDRPSIKKSLYRLRYPGSQVFVMF